MPSAAGMLGAACFTRVNNFRREVLRISSDVQVTEGRLIGGVIGGNKVGEGDTEQSGGSR